MGMTSFRRSAFYNSTSKGPRKGGGGNWYERFKLPKGTSTPFALINSKYIDPSPNPELVELGENGQPLPVENAFYKYKKHRRKIAVPWGSGESFKDTPCSAGNNPHNPQPCAGCTAMDMGDKSVTASDAFVFGIIHLAPYHRHPLFDKESGQMRKRTGDGPGAGEPIYTYTECTGRNCNFCATLSGKKLQLAKGDWWPPQGYNPADIKTEFGHRRFLEVGKNHLSNLEGWDAIVSSQCSSLIYDGAGNLLARCSQQLSSVSYNCPNCGDVLIDMTTDERSDEQINQAIIKPYPCMKCSKGVLLEEVVLCENCESSKRAHLQLGMFDVILWGTRQGEGTKSQLMLQQFQTVEEFQKTLPPHIKELLNGKTVEDIIKELSQPYDFDKIFGSRSWEDQCKVLQLNLPPPGSQMGQSAYAQFAPPTGGPVYNPAPPKPNFGK